MFLKGGIKDGGEKQTRQCGGSSMAATGQHSSDSIACNVDPGERGDQRRGNPAVDIQAGREQLRNCSNVGAIACNVEVGGDDGIGVFDSAGGGRRGKRGGGHHGACGGLKVVWGRGI